ncbi:MAG: hypothetical protein ACLU9S_04195 [Oscillospiraceae bacterium]
MALGRSHVRRGALDASTQYRDSGEEGRQLADTLIRRPGELRLHRAPPAAPLRVQAKIRYQASPPPPPLLTPSSRAAWRG